MTKNFGGCSNNHKAKSNYLLAPKCEWKYLQSISLSNSVAVVLWIVSIADWDLIDHSVHINISNILENVKRCLNEMSEFQARTSHECKIMLVEQIERGGEGTWEAKLSYWFYFIQFVAVHSRWTYVWDSQESAEKQSSIFEARINRKLQRNQKCTEKLNESDLEVFVVCL